MAKENNATSRRKRANETGISSDFSPTMHIYDVYKNPQQKPINSSFVFLFQRFCGPQQTKGVVMSRSKIFSAYPVDELQKTDVIKENE